jgi:predicted nucleic acid-binding protein
MNEFLEVGSRPSISIKFRLPKSRLEDFAQRVEGAAIRIEQVPTVFTYSRDVTDAHYINLAIAAGAHWIVSRDRDLLDLMSSPHRESELFRDLYPSLRVVNPVAFMTEHNLK